MSYLRAKISGVTDAEFQTLIGELYHCVDWRRDDSTLPTLWLVLNAISAQDPKALTPAHCLPGTILLTKVGKLPPGVIYDLCREAADLKRTHIESFAAKTVLSLLKLLAPKPDRPKKLGCNHLRHDSETRTILRRRANGDL